MVNSYKYDSLSFHVTKKQLNRIIQDVYKEKFAIFWGFDRGKMILNIYNEKMNNKLMFIRKKGFLELILAEIQSEQVIDILDQSIQFSYYIQTKEFSLKQIKKEEQYNEIDYYLIQLHRYMQVGNQQKITETKKVLQHLVSSS
ncbi:hypothetical protein [Bacillus solitudinis]|uniref:hypothetical protein n=1 Tax=Bacillus solitudinis TaxID=2014074 RepID=UPI000C2379B8|nr:hypothetical protein [Bacillus solitudinis]